MSRSKQDAANLAAEALRDTVIGAGASMTISSGGKSATISADGVSGHVTENPEDRPYVPPDGSFLDDDDYLEARELTKIGDALIERFDEFTFLARVGARIKYAWKRKGGKSKGRDVFGQCQKPGGLLRHYASCDFVIWIAADHVRESGFKNLQLEALVYHELKHCGFTIDEDENSPTYGEMKLTIRGHDDEVFLDELRRYGAWNSSRQRAGEAYAQIALPSAA